MSVGRVINGKLAVREGRLACDCCGGAGGPVDPPPLGPGSGCLACNSFQSNYFFECTGADGPDVPPQSQDGCGTNPLPWRRPTVIVTVHQLVCTRVSGSSFAPYIEYIMDDNSPITLDPSDISMSCGCLAFGFYKDGLAARRAAFNLPGVPGHSLVATNGYIEGGNSIADLSFPLNPSCASATLRDARMLVVAGHFFNSPPQVFRSICRANVANASPCYGASIFSGNRFSTTTNPGTVETIGYTLSGNCGELSMRWSGTGVVDNWFGTDFEWDIDIEVQIGGMAPCLIV